MLLAALDEAVIMGGPGLVVKPRHRLFVDRFGCI